MKTKKYFLGFTIIETMIVVAILGILFLYTVFSSNFAREKIYKDTCIDNLRRIHMAKEFYANEYNKESGDICDDTDLNHYVQGGITSLFCPLDPNKTFASSYDINAIGTDTPPCCKILPNGKDGAAGNSDDHRITP